MRETIIISSLTVICLTLIIMLIYKTLSNLILEKVTEGECTIQKLTITAISKGMSNNIIFSSKQGEHYYISHGLARGLNLDYLKDKVLNKSVTLHLPKLFRGAIVSEHIAQIAIGEDIIFTELI